MTIRQIKKEFGVGNEKAHFIKKQLYGDINISPGRPPQLYTKMNMIMLFSTNKTLMLAIKGSIMLQNKNANAQRH